MKSMRNWVLGIILGSIIVFTTIILCVLGGWNNVWGMSGECDFGDKTRYTQECVFNKEMYQDYKIQFSVAVMNGECDVRLLDKNHNVIYQRESVTADFQEELNDEVIEQLVTGEVYSNIPLDDELAGVSYSVYIDGKKELFKNDKEYFQK